MRTMLCTGWKQEKMRTEVKNSILNYDRGIFQEEENVAFIGIALNGSQGKEP